VKKELFEFRIFLVQGFKPEEGQAALDKIHEMVKNMPAQSGSVFRIDVPGANRYENPYPDWLKEEIEMFLNNFVCDRWALDSTNWLYRAEGLVEKKVREMEQEFYKLRNKFAEQHVNDIVLLTNLQYKICEEVDPTILESAGVVNF